MGSLEASFHVEGSPCILEGPGNQYELPSWTYTAPRTSHPFSHRTKRACKMARVAGPCGVAHGQLRHREGSLRPQSTGRPQLSTVVDLHCAAHCSPSLPSHQGHMFDMARVGGPCGVALGQLRHRGVPLCPQMTARPVCVAVTNLRCASHSSASLPSHR